MAVGEVPFDGPAAIDGVWLKALAGGTNRFFRAGMAGAYDGVFLDAALIPPRLEVVEFDSNNATGAIASVLVTNPGRNYTHATVTANSLDGSGATFTATISPIVQGAIVATSITAPGQDYTTATATITTSTGSGATLTPVIVEGEVVALEITAAGSGYAATDTVTITGDGTGATAKLFVGPSGGQITAITASGGNDFYNGRDTVVISGDGEGATAQLVITTTAMSAQLPIADEPGTILLLLNASPNPLNVFPNQTANRLTNSFDTLNGQLTTAAVVASQSLAWFAYATPGRWIGGPPPAPATTSPAPSP